MPCYNTAPYKRLRRLLYHLCSYAANATKQRAELYRRFSCDYARSTAHYTRPTQAAIIPSAPRWSVSQRRSTSNAYQIPPPRRDAVQVSASTYYNKVYKGATLLWIHARRCSISQTMQARRRSRYFPRPAACSLAPVSSQGTPGQPGTIHPAGQSSSRSAAGGAEPLAALAVSFFGLSPDS